MIIRRTIAAVLMLASLPAASQAPPVAPDWSGAQTLTVKLSSFRFDPATITLRQGQAYDLRLENTSSGGHNFAAKEFFAAARVLDVDRVKVAGGKVRLDGGQNVDIHVIAPHAGTYRVHCTHFMHSAFGMTGEIVVQ